MRSNQGKILLGLYQTTNFINLVLFLLMSCPSMVLAKQEGHASTEAIVEYSLMGLKNSVSNIAEQNEQLKAEIQMIQTEIRKLKEQLASGAEKKQKLLSLLESTDANLTDESQELSLTEKGLNRIQNDVKSLEDQHIALESQFNIKQKETEDLQDNLTMLRSSIKQLKSKISSFELGKENGVSLERKKLLVSFQESQESLRETEERVRKIKQQYTEPKKIISQLKQQQDLLKQQWTIVQDEFNMALEAGKKIQGEVETLEKADQDKISQLNSSLEQLKLKNHDYENVLAQTKAKYSANSTSLVNYGEQQLMKDSLNMIKNENITLKEEFTRLDETLRKIYDNSTNL